MQRARSTAIHPNRRIPHVPNSDPTHRAGWKSARSQVKSRLKKYMRQRARGVSRHLPLWPRNRRTQDGWPSFHASPRSGTRLVVLTGAARCPILRRPLGNNVHVPAATVRRHSARRTPAGSFGPDRRSPNSVGRYHVKRPALQSGSPLSNARRETLSSGWLRKSGLVSTRFARGP